MLLPNLTVRSTCQKFRKIIETHHKYKVYGYDRLKREQIQYASRKAKPNSQIQ